MGVFHPIVVVESLQTLSIASYALYPQCWLCIALEFMHLGFIPVKCLLPTILNNPNMLPLGLGSESYINNTRLSQEDLVNHQQEPPSLFRHAEPRGFNQPLYLQLYPWR